MGDNFHPSYLGINPTGTVPVLLVPNADSIKPDRAPEYTRITDTKNIVHFLSKKKKTIPSLIPLPHLVKKSNELIDKLYSGELDTNFLMLSATNPSELDINSSRSESYLISRQTAFDRYRHQCPLDRKQWFENKSQINLDILNVYRYRFQVNDYYNNSKSSSSNTTDVNYLNNDINILDQQSQTVLPFLSDDYILSRRKDFFLASISAWHHLKSFIKSLDSLIEGPWILGNDLSMVDLHLIAFLVRVISDLNGTIDDNGILKLTNVLNIPLNPKLDIFWKNWIIRSSFKFVYMTKVPTN